MPTLAKSSISLKLPYWKPCHLGNKCIILFYLCTIPEMPIQPTLVRSPYGTLATITDPSY